MDTVLQQYKTSVHYQNQAASGNLLRRHPKEWVPKIVAKTRATFNELPKKIIGTIDTPEKFKAKRLELAEHVWAKMKETDSRECRNCHALESMELDKQDKSAQKKHSLQRKLEKGETCIDCHKGIAHGLPEVARLSSRPWPPSMPWHQTG
jgi:nitrate/TMAO reductase-like tetraheme cytochrome c subunit